jgi:hypothetical protein
MGWLTQPYYDKGKAEGLAEGLAEGKTIVANGLARLLEKRFGVVPDLVRQRIFSADTQCIEAWFERALDAPDLQAVFDSNWIAN